MAAGIWRKVPSDSGFLKCCIVQLIKLVFCDIVQTVRFCFCDDILQDGDDIIRKQDGLLFSFLGFESYAFDDLVFQIDHALG